LGSRERGDRRRDDGGVLVLDAACFSGACFVAAFPRESQQAFLEAHVAAFEFFGGYFVTCRYDKLSSAVKTVLKGRRRVETDRFVALRSHYLFSSEFTRVGLVGAPEKGGVEGEVGRFRRSHLVPVPEVASLAELNDLIAAGCIRDLDRTIRGRRVTVGEALGEEIDLLRALPAEPFDSCEHVRVSRKGSWVGLGRAGGRGVGGAGPVVWGGVISWGAVQAARVAIW
jgi:hypothetical protein